jgi:hypothetical protein
MPLRPLVILPLLAAFASAALAAPQTGLTVRKPRVVAPEVVAGLRGKRVFVEVEAPAELQFYGRFHKQGEQLLHARFDPGIKTDGDALLVTGSTVPDPTRAVADDLARALQSRFGTLPADGPQSADLRLRAKTVLWRVARMSKVVATMYEVYYVGEISIEDARTGEKLFRTQCNGHNFESANKDLEAYLANAMATLKKEFSDLSKSCPVLVVQAIEGKK